MDNALGLFQGQEIVGRRAQNHLVKFAVVPYDNSLHIVFVRNVKYAYFEAFYFHCVFYFYSHLSVTGYYLQAAAIASSYCCLIIYAFSVA